MYTIGVDGNGKLTLLKDTERVIDGRSQVLGAPYVVIVGGVPGHYGTNAVFFYLETVLFLCFKHRAVFF
jgi:hypothetical protein